MNNQNDKNQANDREFDREEDDHDVPDRLSFNRIVHHRNDCKKYPCKQREQQQDAEKYEYAVL